MTKAYTKNDIKAMKETFLTTPYKGKPYMDYLRDKNKNKYIKYLRAQVKYLNTNKPIGSKLGNYCINLFNVMSKHFEEFYADPVADGSNLDDIRWFRLPTMLMTGKDVYEHTQNILNSLDMFKRDISKKYKQQLLNENEKKWIQQQKKIYFSFNVNKLINMSKEASNLLDIYVVKLNQNGTFANISKATFKDIEWRLQKLLKKYTSRKYSQEVNKVNKINNELVQIHTDCEIAVIGHLDMDKTYENHNACDITSIKYFKRDKDVLSHLPKCKESQLFRNNILNIFKITNQIIKNNKCTKIMNDKQQKLYLPLNDMQDILRQRNFERIM